MKNNTQTLPDSLIWRASTHEDKARSQSWYIGFALASIGLMAFAFFYDHSLTTIITFGLIIVIVLWLSHNPRSITYKITKTGLAAGSTVYPYKIVKQFWILYSPPEVKKLNFVTTAYLNNQISFDLGDQDPMLVKLVLGQYIPEDLDREESFSETLARTLKI
jgi:hypothetical protein